MARMYPEKITNAETPTSEHKVFNALKHLDNDWIVLHSVAWQGVRHGKQCDGEVDFVVAHPTKGAFTIEVKGGGIHIANGQWTSTDRHGNVHPIKNPFEQVLDSKHFLGEYLSERIPKVGNKVNMGHAVWFPDIEIFSDLGPETNKSIVLNRLDLDDPKAAIGRLATHWDNTTCFDTHQFAELRKALAPTRSIRRVLRYEVEDRKEDLLHLTERQIDVLHLLRRQRRAMITGGAGTGKTVLASERSRQLADDGHTVLLLCFNAPLGDKLGEDLADVERVTAGSFHKFAWGIVAEAGNLPDEKPEREFWDETLPDLMTSGAEQLDVSFDAIIIDEGQDFHPNWWTALGLILTDSDNGFLYVFADSHQDLYRVGWEPPFEGQSFPLNTNCRNTIEIAERVGAVFGRDEPSLGVHGPPPKFIEIGNFSQASKQLQKILESLIERADLEPDQITVLSTDREFVDKQKFESVGEYQLVEPRTSYGIGIDTVHRFKGLESDAIVLVLPKLDGGYDRALAYVGMSRARVLLYVIGTAEVKAALNWA